MIFCPERLADHPHMFYCIERAPLLSNFLACLGRILTVFPLQYPLATSNREPLSLLPLQSVPNLDQLNMPRQVRLPALKQLAFTVLSLLACGGFGSSARAQESSTGVTAREIVSRLEVEREQLTNQLAIVRAKGKVTGWVQAQGATEPTTNLDAELLIMRSGARFHLQLLHAPQPTSTPPAPERLEVVMFDGQTIYTVSSAGSEVKGGVFFEFSQSAVVRSAGFPFTTLLNFWDDAISLKEIDLPSSSVIDLGQQGLILKEDRATYCRQLFLGTKRGFDLERVALRHPGASVAFREHWLTWQNSGQQAYVQRYVVRHRYALKEVPVGQVIARQNEVEIEEFSLGQVQDDSTFSLKGLGIPVGTKFIDYRRNVKGRRLALQWTGQELVPLENEDLSDSSNP
jgi:hypothetical protein